VLRFFGFVVGMTYKNCLSLTDHLSSFHLNDTDEVIEDFL